MARTTKTKESQADRVSESVSDSFSSGNGTLDSSDLDLSSILESDLEIHAVGPADFETDTLLHVYRTMLTSRRLDEKMLTLLKQGKGFFHIGCAGHEATQAATGLLLKPGHDWFNLYYRDLTNYLMLDGTPEEVMLLHYSKASDPNSGGRQMSEHYSSPERFILPLSSSVGSQFLPTVGCGLALQYQETDALAFCSCGDGATSQGDFHEALNWSARSDLPVFFLVQDNKYAISVPVEDQTAGGTAFKLARGYEGLSRIVADGTDFFEMYAVAKATIEHIRSGNGPVCVVANVVRLLPHSSSDDHAKYRTPDELKEDRDQDPIVRLEDTLRDANILTDELIEEMRAEVTSTVEAASTWADAQADPEPESATRHVYFEGKLDLAYESSEPSGETIVLVDAINHALHEEMERNDKMVIYGEDVAGDKGGVFTATRDLTDRFGPDRCFNAPLAEASIVGTAVGLAAAGYKPVVEIQFADYIWPAMQMLRNQVASFRYRSDGAWGCPMVIRVPTGGYIHGGPCHSQNIEGLFAHWPGLLVAFPSNAADAKGLLKTAIRMEDPIIFLEHKGLYRSAAARSPEPDSDYLLPFGKANVVKTGTDVTIVTYGMMVHKSVAAARQLESEGISVEIIDLRTILPMDSETIFASVEKTNRALIVYEDHEFGGFGAEISAQLADKMFGSLDAPIRRVAGKFAYIGFADPIERALLPQDEDILNAVRSLAAY